jgi:putative membrane protein
MSMMFWYNHNLGGWGWFAMSASMILFWVLIITAAVMLFRVLGRQHEHSHAPHPHSASHPAAPTPEQVLADRFARGEIDEEEYRRRLATLHSSTRPGTS